MTTIYKILGQSSPSANTATSLYTVPASNSAVISTLSICNTNTGNVNVNVAIRGNGDATATKHALVSSTNIVAKDTMFLTVGIALSASDIVEVSANIANVAFSAFGSEITS